MRKSESDLKLEKIFNRFAYILFPRKSSDKYKHKKNLECQKIALENNAKLMNEFINYKSYLEFLFDNQIIKISYEHLKRFGFPKDIEKYNAIQKLRNRTDEDKLEEFRLKLLNHGATLLDTEWKGSNFKYSFQDYQGNINTIKSYEKFPLLKSINRKKRSTINNHNKLNALKLKFEAEGATLLDTEWKGSQAIYNFKDYKGNTHSLKGSYPIPKKFSINNKENIKAHGNQKMENLKLRLSKDGATLLDTEWKGFFGVYEFKDYKGNIGRMKACDRFPKKHSNKNIEKDEKFLNRMREALALRNATLLSNQWNGSNKKYLFIDSMGEFHAVYYESLLDFLYRPKKNNS